MRHLWIPLVLWAGCAKATGHETPGETSPTPTTPAVAPMPAPPPPPPPKQVATRIELTAVTLADDCGGTPPWTVPTPAKTALKQEEASEPKAKAKTDARFAKRRCEQTSMQLAVIAGDATTIHVKSVELFDEAGKSLGKLDASKPTRWTDAASAYEVWDETVPAGSTNNVSYVLAQPKWDHIGDRWNKTYTLKTVLSVGGVDQAAEKAVTLTAPASLPPNVKT